MNPEELLRLLQQFQASQQTQAKSSPLPQRSIMDILGGDTTPEGSSIFAYGGGGPVSMPESNERVRMILEALQAGEAPGTDPLIGPQAQKDFTPINPQPGQTFGLQGYQDEGFGFNPQTRAFTNIGVPKAPGATLDSNLGLTPEELQAAIQGYLTNGETPPEVLTGAKPAQSKSKMAPADIAKMAELSTALDKAKVPSEVKTMILQRSFPQYEAQQAEDKLEVFRQQKEIAKTTALAPKGLYLDKEGNPLISSPLTFGDIPEGAIHYELTSPQGKLAASIPLLLSHVNQTVDEVNKIAPKGKSALQLWIQAKIKEWQNDPAQRALGQMLEPASAMAMGTLYASGGTQTRGGVQLAEMFKNSFYSPGNDIPAVKEKLSVALGLMKEIAIKQNLHPRYLQELEDLQTKVTSMGGSSKAQKVSSLPDPLKVEGQVFIGSDGSRNLASGGRWIDITNQGAQ